MGNTVNYSLETWAVGEYTDTFGNFIAGMSGASNSNMVKIDAQMKTNADNISSVTSYPIKTAVATKISDSYYTVVASNYTAYEAGNFLALLLDYTSSGALTINVNSIGVKSVMKYDSDGTLAEVISGEVVANYPTLIMYDGTRWVIIGHGLANQIVTDSGDSVQDELDDCIRTISTTTPTSITGILLGDGSVVSSASAGVDYLTPIESPTDGNFASLNASGVVVDSGSKASDFSTTEMGLPIEGASGQALLKTSSDNYAVEWANIGRTNPDILHNSDWRTPFNQRGVTGAVSSAYCIDRWIGNGTVTPVAGSYVTIENGTTMIQRLEILPNKLYGATYTVGVDIAETIYSGAIAFPSFLNIGTPNTGPLTGANVTAELGYVDLGSGNSTLIEGIASRYIPYLKLTATAEVSIKRVKLELGDVCTIQSDPPRPFRSTRDDCERFTKGLPLNYRARAYQVGANSIDFCYPLTTPFRASPPTLSAATEFTIYTLVAAAQTGFTFSVINLGDSYLGIRAFKTSHGLTDAYIGVTVAGYASVDL